MVINSLYPTIVPDGANTGPYDPSNFIYDTPELLPPPDFVPIDVPELVPLSAEEEFALFREEIKHENCVEFYVGADTFVGALVGEAIGGSVGALIGGAIGGLYGQVDGEINCNLTNDVPILLPGR